MSENTKDQAHQHEHLDAQGMSDAAVKIMAHAESVCPCPVQRQMIVGMILMGLIAESAKSDRGFREDVETVVNIFRQFAKQGRDLNASAVQIILPGQTHH